jgi:uncharacterized membrane protein
VAGAAVNWSEPGAAYLLAGSLLHLVGTLVVTFVFNVPLNNRLASVEPDSPEAGEPMGAVPADLDGLESCAEYRIARLRCRS